jgi:hypothetical protein
MNRVVEYSSTGLAANQIATLDHIGMFDAPLSNTPDKLPVRPPLNSSAAIGDRAHSWLATNCSFCHHSVGVTDLPMDFRYGTPIKDMKVCNERPVKGDLGIADAYRVAPGDPSRSVLHARISRRGAQQMPPLATRMVDDQGVGIITEWIQSLSGGCP